MAKPVLAIQCIKGTKRNQGWIYEIYQVVTVFYPGRPNSTHYSFYNDI